MRTLRVSLLPLALAGGMFAQDQVPAPPQFTPVAPKVDPVQMHPLLRFAPLTVNPTLPGVNPYQARSTSRCAVPLIEMQAPSATDSISRTPPPTGDPIAVPPPVPSCSDVTSSGFEANAAERLKHLQEAREKLKQWKEAQPATPPADTAPAPK